jgi:fumarate reductase subunit C
MSATPRVDAMKPRRPGPTRTAPPHPPGKFPFQAGLGRRNGPLLAYITFGSCGIFFLLSALLVLRAVWALGDGAGDWQQLLADFGSPAYLIYHAIAFVALVWFTLRFFRLFPKTQPPRIGPAKRPPDAFFAVALNGAFVVVSAALVAVLWGAVL